MQDPERGPMSPVKRWWPFLAGGLVLLAAGIVWWINTDHRRVYLEFEPALSILVVGALAVAAAVLLQRQARRSRRREAEAVARARAEAAAVHRHDRLQLLSRLDHELKNPLTALRLGLAGLPGAEPAALQTLSDQVDRLSRLTGDLRKLAALESGPLDLAPVDLSQVLAEVVADVADFDDSVGVELNLPRGPWPLPTVRGDRDLLQAAVMNVVVNAVKFSRPGGLVEVRAREEPGPPHRVVVEIADTGVGIAPDEVELVWQELARGRQAHGRPGTGIGLALVQIVVRRHGGRSFLRSRLGAGTVVTLELPV